MNNRLQEALIALEKEQNEEYKVEQEEYAICCILEAVNEVIEAWREWKEREAMKPKYFETYFGYPCCPQCDAVLLRYSYHYECHRCYMDFNKRKLIKDGNGNVIEFEFSWYNRTTKKDEKIRSQGRAYMDL